MENKPKVTVLLVDDEPYIRKLMKATFESLGCKVTGEAENGQEGVDMFRQNNPDLCVLDIHMPVKDGIKALKEIKSEFPDAFVVMLATMSTIGLVRECLDAGAANFIRKDNAIQDIIKLIKQSWKNCFTGIKKDDAKIRERLKRVVSQEEIEKMVSKKMMKMPKYT